MPPSRFILLFAGRTRSTAVIETLRTHPHAIARFEALQELGDAPASARRAWATSYLFADQSPESRAVGFKAKLHQMLEPDPFANMVNEHGVRLIHLGRENTVKAAVSMLNGRRLRTVTGRWHKTQDDPDLSPFSPDAGEIWKWIAHRERSDRQIAEFCQLAGAPTLRLSYEQFAHEPGAFWPELCAFIGLDHSLLKPHAIESVKVTQSDLSNVLTNFNELHNAFDATIYQDMLLDTTERPGAFPQFSNAITKHAHFPATPTALA